MEFIFVFCSVLVYFLLVKIVHKLNTTSKYKLPPGPKKLPFIGNIHQLLGSSLPHHTFKNLARKYGPIMHLQLGETPLIVVSSPEIAKEVLRTHDLIFANRPISQASWIISYHHSDIAFAPYGDHWRQMRKICTLELLSPKQVQKFRYIREDEVSNMMESIMISKEEERQAVNVSRIIFSLSYAVISRAAFGNRSKYHDEFITQVDDITQLLGGFNVSDMFPSIKILQLFTSGFKRKLLKLHNRVDKIVETIVNEHKESVLLPNQESKDHDLVDVLLNIQRHGKSDVPLTDTVIKAVIYDMFSAGGETSSTTMEWAISELVRNPTIMKKAQVEVRQVFDETGNVDESKLDELNYLQNVIKETLRLHPAAVLLLPRECSEECEINGYDIPANTSVLINAWAIGRDPKCWGVDADKFNPDRFLDSKIEYKGNNFEYVPFGGGRRICPGISFAIPNIQLTLAHLLFHFDWQLPPGNVSNQELDMTEKFGVTVRRKNDLHLIPVPYHRSCFKGCNQSENVLC